MHGRNITFLSGLDGAEEFSIRPSAKMDHLLFTLGKQRRAVEYRISDKNVVNSYFLPSHMSFSTPIIKHGIHSEDNFQLACVVDKTKLIFWNGKEETRLEKIKGIVLAKPVKDIIEENGMNSFVVFENGDVQSMEYVCQNPKIKSDLQSFHHLPQKIVRTEMIQSAHCLHIGTDSASLHKLTLNGNKYDQTFVKSFFLKSASHIALVGNNLIHVVKNDPSVVVKNVFDNNEEAKFGIPEASRIIALTKLNDNHIAIMCKCGQDENMIKIVNINFGTIVSSLAMKTFSSNQLVCVDGNKIMFKQGARIACWTLDNLPSGLGDLVGTGINRCSNISTIPKGDADLCLLENEHSSFDLLHEVLTANNSINGELNDHLPDIIKVALIENALSNDTDVDILRKVLLIPITDEVVIDHIKNLKFSSVKIFILKLIQIMEKLEKPEDFEHYITWLALLLDAHYSSFMVTKDQEAITVIEECARLLGELDYSVNMLATLMSRMKMMKKDKQFSHAHNKLFSVEVVYF